MRPSCSNRALTPVIRLLLATLVLVQYLGTASVAQTIYASANQSGPYVNCISLSTPPPMALVLVLNNMPGSRS
jgi:hypothetical protein